MKKLSYYSRWYFPAIRELVALDDFRADPFWMSARLGILPTEARDGLITLIKLGQVICNDGKYERAVCSIQPKIAPTSLRQYTVSHIERSSAILELDRRFRYANTLTLALSEQSFAKIPEILSRLIAEVDSLAENDAIRTDLAQLNVQFYSVNEFAKIERKSKKIIAEVAQIQDSAGEKRD